MFRATSGLLLLLSSACATSQVFVPSDARPALQRRLEGEDRFLRVSCFVTAFFSDPTRRLVTAVLPDEVRLLANPDQSPVNPGPVEATLPAGTLVRISKVEFPSALTHARRPATTPRGLIWLTLELGRDGPAHVLVLPPGIKNGADLFAEVGLFLDEQDPAPLLAGFPDPVREAVATKRAIVDMPAEALQMAWGPPQSKRITFEDDKRHETWTWPGGKRIAPLTEGRVTELK